MDLGLKGKLAVVTGSTKGIGFAIAAGFARHGALVVVNGRTQATVDEAKARVVAQTGAAAANVFALAGDLATTAGFEAFVAGIDAIGKPVEILVNNHGVFDFADFFEVSDSRWQEYFEINLFASVRLTRKYLKGMLERKTGRVLFTSSVAGEVPLGAGIPYSVTKTAQISLARGLSELTKGTEVTVNSVVVGPTATEGALELFGKLGAQHGVTAEQAISGFIAKEVPNYKLTQLETPDEIANVFLFLASKHGLVINGVAQRADGGVVGHI